MAIDYAKLNSGKTNKSGIDYKKLNALIPTPPPAPEPVKAPEVTMPTPVENAQNLYAGKGFQAFGKTTGLPAPSPLYKSSYNPFANIEIPSETVAPKTAGSTPAVDLTAKGPLEQVFGAVRAVSDVATLPITVPIAMFDKKSTVKDIVDSTLEMAKADVETGGAASIDKAVELYAKNQQLGKYGGKDLGVKDYAVLGALGFANMFGDVAFGVGELAGLGKAAKFAAEFKKTGTVTKALEEGKTFTSTGKGILNLSDDVKLVIDKSKNEVKFTGFVRRGSKGEILNTPLEISGVADDIAKTTGQEIVATTKGNDLILKATGKPSVAVTAQPVKGINYANELAKVESPAVKTATPSEGLIFSGQEQLAPTTQPIQAEVPALDFNAPAVQETAQTPTVNVDDVITKIKSQAVNSGFKGINISDAPITDLINKQAAPTGVDILNKAIKINREELLKDVESLVRGNGIELPDGTVTKDVDEYIRSLVQFEKQHLQNATIEDIQNLRSGNQEVINKTLEDLDRRAVESYKAETVKTPSTSTKVQADKGEYADIKYAPVDEGGVETKLKTIETPEQYRLAKAISPDLKFVMKNSKSFNGYFKPQAGAEEIGMNRALYKRKKDETKEDYQTRIGKTMAHEIGHLIDFLPDKITKRGNLIGHLQTLSNFKKNFIAEPEVLAKRQELMRKIREINNNDELLDSMQAKLTEPLFKELADLNKSITFNNPVFKDELVKLSKTWKPWEEGVDATYDSYRKSAAELYADFNSVLFNDPALAQEIAPRFYDEFFRSLGKKPEVEKEFLAIQGELMGDRASLMEKRYKMLKESGQNAQGRFAAMVAERDALRKKPWLNSLMKEAWYQHYWASKKGEKVENLMEVLDRGFNNEDFIWTKKHIEPIMNNLEKAKLDAGDMDAVLILDRISKDITRENVANIKGLDVKTAEDVLNELENIIGKEKADVIVNEAINFRKALKEKMLMFPDLYTEDDFKLIESNDFYAPFNVLFNESNNIGYYIKQSKGNIDKDFSPFINTLLRAKAVSHFGAKNDIKKNVIDIFLEQGKDDIKKAEVTNIKIENGQMQRNVKKAPQGWDIVEIKRGGKVESYYMPEDIANSLNQDNLGQLSSIMKPFSIMTKPFKQLYTGIINPGFQVVNFLFRDWGTSEMFFGPEWTRAQQGKSNAGLNILANNTYRTLIGKLNQAKWYYKAFKNIKDKNIYQKYSPIVEEALKNHVIEVDASGLYKIDTKNLTEQEQAGIKYILQTIGLLEKGTKWQQFTEKTQGLAQSFEETPKLAAYMYMKQLGVLDDKNLSTIRNYVGSPNFWKQGRENKNISSLLMFYNPIIRGIENLGKKAFVKDAAGTGSRSAFWYRMARAAVLPALLGVAAEEGFFGEDIKKKYRLLPEYLKGNYLNIPMNIDENGKVTSVSIPMDEDARMIHAMTRNVARMALHSSDKAIRTRALTDILAYTGGMVPGTTPTISIGSAWTTAMSGGNPYDSFRRQHIFLANEEKLPQSEKAKIMAKWTLNQSGMLKLELHDAVENRTIQEQIIANMPVINRFVRTVNRGEYEEDQAVVKEETEKAAMELLKKKMVVNDIVEAVNKDPKYNSGEALLKLAKERLGAEAADQKALTKEFKTLNSAMQEQYITNFGNIHYRSLINQSNDVKEKLLLDIRDRKTMTEKEYLNFLLTSRSLNIISDEILGNVLTQTGLGSVK